MNRRVATLLVCSLVEVPLLLALMNGLDEAGGHLSLVLAALVAYHLLPLALLYGVLLAFFGHSAPAWIAAPYAWDAYWVCVFVIQTAVTYFLLSWARRRFTPRRSHGQGAA